MVFRDVTSDGTVRLTGAPPGAAEEGGATTALEVTYNGSTGLSASNVEGALDELDAEKAPLTHNHDARYYTEVEVTNLLTALYNQLNSEKAPVTHQHDSRYYTEAEVDQKIAEAQQTQTLHMNPGFEIVDLQNTDPPGEMQTGGPQRPLPVNWGNFWGDPAVISDSADNTVTRSGTGWSLKSVQNAAGGMSHFSTGFAVVPGALVTIEAWVRVQGTGGQALISLITHPTVYPEFFQADAIQVDTAVQGPTSGGWVQIRLTQVIPAGHTRAKFALRSLSTSGVSTVWWDDTNSNMQIIPPSGVVTGEIKMWPQASAPDGYLLCQGQEVAVATYPTLNALLGTTFGARTNGAGGAGTTHFRLPDFRGRMPLGAGTASPAVAGGTNHTLAQKGGEEKHTQTEGELATHTHGQNPHSHQTMINTGLLNARTAGGAAYNVDGGGSAHTSQATATNQHTGGGNAFNVLNPFLGINFIIKT